MLYPISLATIACSLLWALSKYGMRNALSVGLAVWALALVMGIIPVLIFNVDYSFGTDAFVAACTLALTIAYAVVRKSPNPPPARANEGPERVATIIVLGLGLLGCGLALLDAYIHGSSLSISGFMSNLGNARELSNDAGVQAARGARAMHFVGINLTAFAYVGILAAIALGRERGNRTIFALGIANFIGVAAVSLLVFAGRTILIDCVLLMLVSVILGVRVLKIGPRTIAAVAVLVVATWFFAVSYFTAREGPSANVESYLRTLERAELPKSIRSTVLSNPGMGSALVNYGYFAAAPPSLSWYLQQGDPPGPYWGGYSFPMKTLLLSKVGGGTNFKSSTDMRFEVFNVLESRGYYGNIWATWLRDLVVDFGYLGAALFCAIFGAFMAWVRNRFEKTGSIHFLALESIAGLTFAFGAFQNLLLVNVYQSVFFAALAFWLLVVTARSATTVDVDRVIPVEPSLAGSGYGIATKRAVPIAAAVVWAVVFISVASMMRF